MPIHDWTRVVDGAFHAFHLAWIAGLQKALNSGILPPDYYAMADAPPRVRLSERLDVEPFTRRQRSVVIHHASDDRVIALIEILSAGNKSSKREFDAFLSRAVGVLDRGYHLLVIDLHPRTNRDPEGVHFALWTEAGGTPTPRPADEPLTLAAYDAGPARAASVEPVAVGDTLSDMPLFLAPGWYVSVPLEATYQAAWEGVPRRYREVLEPPVSG